jgi:hypothetical protein
MANGETELSEAEFDTIVRLLRTTQMTIEEIARQIGCSPAVVASIKRRFVDRPPDRPS